MKNYSNVNVGNEPRSELHELLGLTGAEMTVNNLPAGACVPFIHSHKENEEIYYVLAGEGKLVIDEETVELVQGSAVKVSPAGRRQIFATTDLSFICIQVKENSLEHYTATDAIM